VANEIDAAQPVTPFLYYDDVAAGIEWLASAYGFQERFRLDGPSGVVLHAEVYLGEGRVMLGNVGPRNAGPRPNSVRSGVYVFVDDVDAHYERARAAGALIVSEPVDQPFGDRLYMTTDNEGHEWYFAQHIRDVSLDELRGS
jgi:PhnB protein